MNDKEPLAKRLGEFVAGFDLRTSPQRVSLMEKAKLHLLDGIGVALASTTAEDHYSDRASSGRRLVAWSIALALSGAAR